MLQFPAHVLASGCLSAYPCQGPWKLQASISKGRQSLHVRVTGQIQPAPRPLAHSGQTCPTIPVVASHKAHPSPVCLPPSISNLTPHSQLLSMLELQVESRMDPTAWRLPPQHVQFNCRMWYRVRPHSCIPPSRGLEHRTSITILFNNRQGWFPPTSTAMWSLAMT